MLGLNNWGVIVNNDIRSICAEESVKSDVIQTIDSNLKLLKVLLSEVVELDLVHE